MKSDSLFYQIFQKLPELLGQLLGDDSTDGYSFTSIEVKGLARRIDGLFVPPLDKPLQPLYFAEIQFQTDEKLYERLFTETFLYLGQYQPQKFWYCVAVWGSQNLDKGIPRHYQQQHEAGLLKIVYLDQLPDRPTIGINLLRLVKAPIKDPLEIREEVIQLRQTAQNSLSPSKTREIIELIDNAILCKFPQLTQEELRKMFDLVEIQQTRVYQDAKLEGKLEGKLEAVPVLYQAGISAEIIAQKLAIDLTLVQQTIQQLINNNN